jgi:AcrR family transcriptional regulator
VPFLETSRDRPRAPRRRRGRPRRAATREAIIDATLELLAERGFQAATMAAIAARAGVGKNTIYRRWPSKEELIADAIRELSAELDVPEEGDVRALLLHRLADFAHVFAHPLLGRILPGLLGELQRNPGFAAVYAERVVRPRHREMVALIRAARERGELRKDVDPDVIADLLIGPPLLRLLFPFGLPELPEGWAQGLFETIWAGIAPEASPS